MSPVPARFRAPRSLYIGVTLTVLAFLLPWMHVDDDVVGGLWYLEHGRHPMWTVYSLIFLVVSALAALVVRDRPLGQWFATVGAVTGAIAMLISVIAIVVEVIVLYEPGEFRDKVWLNLYAVPFVFGLALVLVGAMRSSAQDVD